LECLGAELSLKASARLNFECSLILAEDVHMEIRIAWCSKNVETSVSDRCRSNWRFAFEKELFAWK
jgi:hypothetical protein